MILPFFALKNNVNHQCYPWSPTNTQDTETGLPQMRNIDMIFIGLSICMYIKKHIYLQVLSICIKELLQKKKKHCFFFLTNGHEITGWHLPLQVIPVRLLHVRIQTAPSINGRPKINVAWKLCSKTVTAQFKVWPSENGGVRWKNYFMPCTKANNTVQRDFQLIYIER